MEYRSDDVLPNNLVIDNRFEADEVDDLILTSVYNEVCGTYGVSKDEAVLGVDDEGAAIDSYHRYKNLLLHVRRRIASTIESYDNALDKIARRISEFDKCNVCRPVRNNWYITFGYPYFKDEKYFRCLMNADHKEKVSKNEINFHHLLPIRRWTDADLRKLEEGIRENAIEQKTVELMKQRGKILRQLRDPYLEEREKESMNESLENVNRLLQSVKSLKSDVLYGEIYKNFDWLKITAEAFGEARTSEEVQAMWQLCRHPAINRKHWSKAESEALKNIAIKNEEQFWAKIALDLNTNRSEFQCIIQYQRHLNDDLLCHKWEREEDEALKTLVESFRVGDFIPWTSITMCMMNRTKPQVYQRWINSVDPSIKRGRFTPAEDCLIVAAVKHFGLDFQKVASLLPGRKSTQVYTRYKMCLNRIGPLGKWTHDEDGLLLRLVENYGTKKWSEMTKYFENRNRNQVRHRYFYLENWMRKNPDQSVKLAPRRQVGDCNSRNMILWSKIQNVLESTMKTRKFKAHQEENIKISDEELLALKKQITPKLECKKWPVGRKKQKPYTAADKMLLEFARVCYFLKSGRNKNVYEDEEKEKRFNICVNMLKALQAQLAFPFHESVIEEDKSLNEADKYILIKLKKLYDESMLIELDSEDEGSSSLCNQSITPIHSIYNEIQLRFPLRFPLSFGPIIGIRSLLLARNNLRTMKKAPVGHSNALQPWRPPMMQPGDKIVQPLSIEESHQLFSARLFSVFGWAFAMARIMPSLNPEPDDDNSPERRRDRRRTMKNVSRDKRKMMKIRWMEIKGQKRKDTEDDDPLSYSRKKQRTS